MYYSACLKPPFSFEISPFQQARGHSPYWNLQDLITRSKCTASLLQMGCGHNFLPLHQRQYRDLQPFTSSPQLTTTPKTVKCKPTISYYTCQSLKGNSSFTSSIAIYFISLQHIRNKFTLFHLLGREREGMLVWMGRVGVKADIKNAKMNLHFCRLRKTWYLLGSVWERRLKRRWEKEGASLYGNVSMKTWRLNRSLLIFPHSGYAKH